MYIHFDIFIPIYAYVAKNKAGIAFDYTFRSVLETPDIN